MWELDQMLRKTTKHQVSLISLSLGAFASEQEIAVAEAIRESIRDILNESNLSLE
jgi:hypothetical protein